MSTTATTVVKREKASNPTSQEDKDIAEWAKKLASRPTPQFGSATGGTGSTGIGGQQTTINSFFSVQTVGGVPVATPLNANTDPSGIPANQGFDLDSAIGRFTWETIQEDKYVPCLFRRGEKYCCIRMAEISVIADVLRLLPTELFDCINIESHPVTQVEARLLSHINVWHCDGFFGAELFTTKDFVIRTEDVDKFYSYLTFAYSVLSTGGRNDAKDYSKCGFLRVNNDNLIPYTVLSKEEKGVPLFYFEGHTDCLKQKAVPLTGWELAYLKVCCKVQGVRKDLIAGTSLQIIKVSELRAKFPKKTVFTEDCWPPPKPKSLLPKINNGVNNNTPAGFQIPATPPSQADKWSTCTPYKNDGDDIVNGSPVPVTLPISTSAPQASASSVPAVTSITGTSVSVSGQLPHAPSPSHHSHAHHNAQSRIPSVNTPSSHSQSQPPAVSTNTQPQHAVINRNGGINNTNLTVRVANGAPQIPNSLQAKSAGLTKIKVVSPPQDTSRLQIIPENNDPYNRDTAYTVRLIIIDKELMHCINLKPSRNEDYLIVLQEFMNQFFPSVSIYPTAVSVLKSCGVTTYLPNSHQIRTLNTFGFNIQHNWQIPLVPAVDVTRIMNKLKTVFRPRSAVSTEAVLNHSRMNGYSAALSSTR